MAIMLEIESGIISFYDTIRDQVVYNIPTTAAGDIRMEGDDSCSDWVMQLVDRDWCPTETLYEFASITRKLGVDNKIDWYSTFQIVERGKYLDAANELKDAAKNQNEETSSFQELSEMIRFNAEDDREISQPIIDKIVNEKLAQYGLL